jgi:hypothetical protein
VLEAEVFRRGVTGYEEPVFYRGEHVADVRKYDSTLLLALLNAHGRKRGYSRDPRVQLSGEVRQMHTVHITTTKRREYGGKTGPHSIGAAKEEMPPVNNGAGEGA